jgi:phage terminase small subunit
MPEEQIKELVNARKGSAIKSATNNAIHGVDGTKAKLTTKAQKRQRHSSMPEVDPDMTKSLSQLSVSQPSKKKRKGKVAPTTTEHNHCSKYIGRFVSIE